MTIYKGTVKISYNGRGVKLEQGMSVEFQGSSSNPLNDNGGKAITDAFMKKYGLDLKIAGALNDGVIKIEKIG